MPTFPEESRKNGSHGLAVVELEIDGSGVVVETKILEAPDSAIGQTVVAAVSQWRFKGNTIRGKAINVRSKLTFYYVIDRDGSGKVENPKQFR